MNECLEVLGEEWDSGEEESRGMVFANSGIENVRIPSTLKVVEAATFFGCTSLKGVEFSEDLEVIGAAAFAKCPIESVVLP